MVSVQVYLSFYQFHPAQTQESVSASVSGYFNGSRINLPLALVLGGEGGKKNQLKLSPAAPPGFRAHISHTPAAYPFIFNVANHSDECRAVLVMRRVMVMDRGAGVDGCQRRVLIHKRHEVRIPSLAKNEDST